jgi:hypothetical protein
MLTASLRHRRSARLAGFGVCMLAFAPASFATLGGNLSSVARDQKHLKATLQVSAGDRFSVHQMTAATGTKIREYATADGQVFAVAWQGPWRPDLRQLLGEYFADYQQAARTKRTGLNGPLASSSERLVIEMSGHPRAFYGRAYVPGLVPSGVQPADIQ